MSHPAAPSSLEDFSNYRFERVLNEDPLTHTLILLGSLPDPTRRNGRVNAIIRIEKTALDSEQADKFFAIEGLIKSLVLEESTDIYSWFFGWLKEERGRDVKINVICPATEVHIQKYTRQEVVMVRETPELYERIVKPYISAFPSERTQWVENILLGISEQSKILHSSPEFVILPDMKWDLSTISSLYLVALVQDRNLRSLRDLRKKHIGLLRDIRREAERIVNEKWGLGKGGLRLYFHYQPSYYHLHVHIVNANQAGMMGMTVGQAHLLDDIISLLEIEPDNGPGILERMTLTYGLGDQHGLFKEMQAASA
ncbi:scavenger mRNA decapping enzyme [Collybia nuda]|uniref:Scavenger mRNA decapping enzyme n=1 Tax=Collybia nuda TaxID=64659 RepID=A0A9P6CKH5_9AGAR|nr:scavenger mRNA decapping enzyme [Collybia nuda]